MNYERVIEGARLYSRLNYTKSEEEGESLLRELDGLTLDNEENNLSRGAASIVSGRVLNFATDDQKILKRFRVLAAMLDATVEDGVSELMADRFPKNLPGLTIYSNSHFFRDPDGEWRRRKEEGPASPPRLAS
jgi:hypothetical protein